MSIPKKVRRELSADESLQRYFRLLESQMNRRMWTRWRLAQVIRRRDAQTDEVLQIRKLHDTGEGIVVIVS